MTKLLAIDPGNTESGWCIIDLATRRPLAFDKTDNHQLRAMIGAGELIEDVDTISIEMVASYGMAVGSDVFETCVWIGRLIELTGPQRTRLVYRREVKLHHCHATKAKDTNIKQALIDRFASGQRNHGKGTKDAPGWFYGFRADVWQAYALAVYIADRISPPEALQPPSLIA